MASLVAPILFSQRFNISPSALDAAGLLDPILNADTKLFIDPLLLSSSNNDTMRRNGFDALKDRFNKIVRLVIASQRRGDVAWRNAARLLDLNERPETGLGYGGASTSGASRPDDIRQKVLATAKEITQLGETDPQIISLMGMFEDGIGPDTISDLTTNSILPVLCSLTEDFCRSQNVPIENFPKYDANLPENPLRPGTPVILVPKDILRELPLAVDWSDVSRVILEIEEIRDSFNKFLGPMLEVTVRDRKRALRAATLENLKNFQDAFSVVLESSDNYDPNADVLNFYNFRKILNSNLSQFAGSVTPAATKSKDELARIVREIIANFKYQIENNNMWELLWHGEVPKRERASQLLFFALADVFCRANNIDISPETHSGGGPVDFKFSSGYTNRIVVEIKRSMGTVVHGYKTQTEIYKRAARTDEAIFIIINVGKLGEKLKVITQWQKVRKNAGQSSPEIVIVDALKKASASKRDESD
ncbi:hypothetical protein GOFOIKOB_3014 [Methylobacterium tardum]|nr:hypothetical protein GOFOIKOB_3014 [Methylobacterium tardum]